MSSCLGCSHLPTAELKAGYRRAFDPGAQLLALRLTGEWSADYRGDLHKFFLVLGATERPSLSRTGATASVTERKSRPRL